MSEDWTARHAAIVAAPDDEWDRLSEAFDADWKAAYSAAFVEAAMARGWSLSDAESWPEHIVDDALIDAASTFGWCPQRTAAADVLICEMECA